MKVQRPVKRLPFQGRQRHCVFVCACVCVCVCVCVHAWSFHWPFSKSRSHTGNLSGACLGWKHCY